MIDYYFSVAFSVSSTMDERVFAHLILRRAGFDVSEGELTPEAARVVCSFCQHLDDVTPAYGSRARRSGSAIIEQCVKLAVPNDSAVAYRAFVGLHPELRAGGKLSKYRPVARAALAHDLGRIGRPVVEQFADERRFTETDRHIDSDGIRRAWPVS